MKYLIIFFFLFASFANACCCYPSKSCALVIKSTRMASKEAINLFKLNDNKIYGKKIRSINKILSKLNQIESNINKMDNKIKTLNYIQLIYLKNINKTLKDINLLFFQYINSFNTFSSKVSLSLKIDYLLTIQKMNKINLLYLKELLNEN